MRRKFIADPEVILGPEVGSLLLLGLTIGVVLSPSFTPDFVQDPVKTIQNDQKIVLFLAGESGTSELFVAELLAIFAGDDKNINLKEMVINTNQWRFAGDNITEVQNTPLGFVITGKENCNFYIGQLHLDDSLNDDKVEVLYDFPTEGKYWLNCGEDQIIERLTINITKIRNTTKYRQNRIENWIAKDTRMNKMRTIQSVRGILADNKLWRKNFAFTKVESIHIS